MEEEAHEEVEAQKEKDEGKVWAMVTTIKLCNMILSDYISYFIICSIVIEMLLFLTKTRIGIVHGYVHKNHTLG